jgi:flagellar biogenesis protein FliO
MRKFRLNVFHLALLSLVAIISYPGSSFSEESKTLGKTTGREYLDFTEAPAPESTSLGVVGFKMLGSLLIVLVLLIGTLFIIRRLYPGATPFNDPKLKLTKVVEKINLGPRQVIYLLWAVDRILVVSSSNGTIQFLTEIKDKNVLESKIPSEFTDILTSEKMNLSEVYHV